MCTEAQLMVMQTVAEDLFKGQNIIVARGLKNRWDLTSTTILLGGLIEFNSFHHRRDAYDLMERYNIYFKRLSNGTYEAGCHDINDPRTCTANDSKEAVTMFAYRLITEK